jgi:hypothetical protein
MTLKENAEDLLCRFHDNTLTKDECKQQVIICIDEIIAVVKSIIFNYDLDSDDELLYYERLKAEVENY